MQNSVRALAVGVILGLLVGCASKAITKPRSEILKEAESRGQTVMTVDEERAAFYKQENEQKARLLQILAKRSEGNIRDATYRIGANDEIEINVFDVPELNLNAKVGQAGFLSLPLIGGVEASGKTEVELQQELKRRLSSFVKDPQVSVVVANYGSQKVAVLGAVDKPGPYALRKGANSILELIGEAGGVNDKAGNFINFVPAELSGVSAVNDPQARARLALESQSPRVVGDRAIEVRLDHILGTTGGIPLEIPVRGGDMIIVPEAGKVMVDGEVEKPGTYEVGKRATVLGALAAASGITYSAKLDEVEVIRDVGANEKAHLVVDLEKIASGEQEDPLVRNGDIIRVPSESGRRLRYDTFEGIAKIINFGVGGSVNLEN